jgi:hypothetical protein
VAHVRRDHHHRRRRVVHRPTLERTETVKRQDIYDAIGHERDRQARLWSASHAWGEGDCSSPTLPPIVKSAVLAEECGEVARAVLEHDAHNLPRELIQVAAVAVAWLESM